MAGGAGQLDEIAMLRGDAGDDADRPGPLRFEHRALFDMRFQIGQHRVARARGGQEMWRGRRPHPRARSPAAIGHFQRTRRSSVPATARLVSMAAGKREPSSSPNAITSIANGRRLPGSVERGDHFHPQHDP